MSNNKELLGFTLAVILALVIVRGLIFWKPSTAKYF